MKILLPDQYASTPVHELLDAVHEGRIGIDQRLVRAIVDRGEAVIPELIQYNSEHEHQIPQDIIFDVLRHFKSPAGVPFFLDLVRQDPTEVPDELFDALASAGDAVVEPALKLYEELEEEDSGDIAFVLASTRIHDDRIYNLLIQRLEYDVGDAVLQLGLYGDERARPVLEKLLAGLGPDEEWLRRDISDALSQLGRAQEGREAEEFDIWDSYPETAPPHFPDVGDAVIEYLKSPLAEHREAAARFLGVAELEPAEKKLIVQLAKSDPDSNVRAACLIALVGEDKDKALREYIVGRIKDANAPEKERGAALVALCNEIPEDDQLRGFAEEFYFQPSMRALALQAMYQSLDREFSEYIVKHLDDADFDVRREAITGAGYLELSSAADRLKPYFEDEDMRLTALHAYSMCVRAEVTPGRVRALLRRIEEDAGELDEVDREVVQSALDERLMMHGHRPVFHAAPEDEVPETTPAAKTGRNDPCPCGSGKKYKKCCGAA